MTKKEEQFANEFLTQKERELFEAKLNLKYWESKEQTPEMSERVSIFKERVKMLRKQLRQVKEMIEVYVA